jgi:hypothetical protein
MYAMLYVSVDGTYTLIGDWYVEMKAIYKRARKVLLGRTLGSWEAIQWSMTLSEGDDGRPEVTRSARPSLNRVSIVWDNDLR